MITDKTTLTNILILLEKQNVYYCSLVFNDKNIFNPKTYYKKRA